MNTVRIGVIGLGYIGAVHAHYLAEKKVPRADLTAVCSQEPAQLQPFIGKAATFDNSAALIRSGLVDAVIIATPHYSHPDIGIDAFQYGLHVLCEKPLAAHKADGERLLAAHRESRLKFAVMFNLRVNPIYKRIKEIVDSHHLGPVRRINWIMTDWFRSNAYYSSAGWRASWKGEGGGILLNQYAHHLDLIQWMFGMPRRVRAFCQFGKYHPIEVEDEATAYLDYPNGVSCVFVCSTGEAPGANRLEIVGDLGTLTAEGSRMYVATNDLSAQRLAETSQDWTSKPKFREEDMHFPPIGGGHSQITQNFIDAILDGVPLVAPAEEAIRSLELANAMIYSTVTNQDVQLPLDGEAYMATLQKLIAGSKPRNA